MKQRGLKGCLFLLVASTFAAWGQEYKDYDLSQYRLPDITRNELDFSVNSEGDFTNYKMDGKEERTRYGNIGGNLDVTFNRYRNAQRFRGTQRAGVQLSGGYSRDVAGAKNRNYLVGLSYDNSSRFYGDDYEGLFFETGGLAAFSIADGKNYGEVERETKNTQKNFSISIPLRVGKGRIERVEDARQAIYILENLAKRKVLNRTLTDEEIYEFAQVISTVKNKRFFDARLRLIDEVTAVDSFLVQSGALATNGASYFTTLYDYWMYGDLFERKSGTEISGGITPGFEFAKYEEAIAYDSKRLSPAIVADVRLDYEKPMNLYWQNSAMVRLYGGYEYLHYDYESGAGLDSKLNNYNANLNARYGFGYYPNSRTNINLGVEELLSWNKLANKDADLGSDSYVGTHTSLYLDLYYYFSPQLRLAAEGNLGYRYSERDSYNGWTGNFVLTLTYSLF